MDLSTTYMGMKLRSPLVVSASGFSKEVQNFKKIEDAGAGAIVMYSLFEEQLRQEERQLATDLRAGIDSFAEALSYFPPTLKFHLGPDEYLEHIRKAKAAVGIPVIASLNGCTPGGWTGFAKKIEEAGANALELNIYSIPTCMEKSGEEIEKSYIEIVKSVKAAVKIPVAVKLSPFFTSMANMAKKLDTAGANALVLFNRFYQPDIDLEKYDIVSNLLLSTPHDIRLPITWIGILYQKVKADLAATSGVHTGEDALKALMAGANVAMVCASLYKNGIDYLKKMEEQLKTWMEKHQYQSIQQLRGSLSQVNCPNPSAFERAQYMKTITEGVK